jgi:uncharacterized phage protein (TIGR01671 family)
MDIKYRQPIRDKKGNFLEWHYWGCIDGEWITWVNHQNGQDTRKESQKFTGLLDKNGKEIYVGDIVNYSEYYFGDYKEKECVEPVIWDEEEASYPYKLTYTGYANGPDWREVIGNIVENSELLGD